MTNPRLLCKNHLLGEHFETHKFLHNWEKKHKIDGRIKGNAIEPMSYKKRHDELAKEMIKRGMNHKSPMKENPDFSYLCPIQRNFKVNVEKSYQELINRCENCRKLKDEYT